MQIQKPLLLKIATLKNLPTLPHILLKLINACNQDRGSLKDISIIIETDPSLSIKILRLVNSAYYGLPRRVENMEQAVALVGINAIKNIAICASVYEAFNQAKGNAIFNLKLFWWHSLKCAVLSRFIAKKTGYSHPDEAFLSGLLHDIGRLVLWVNFPEQYAELLEAYKDEQHLIIVGETQLGATHSEVGGWLLHRWKLQSLMADSVMYHHEPKSRILNALPLVQIVYVANALCRKPIQGEEKGPKIAKDIFGFSGPDVEEFLYQSEEETKQVAKSLHIEIEQPKGLASPFSESDLKKQKDLVHEVKHFSLLLGTLQDLLVADDQDAILRAIHQGFQILFDLKNVIFFLCDPEKNGLIGKTVTEDKKCSMIKDIIIPMQMEKSLLITSLLQGKPLDSFNWPTDQTRIILDDQIIRLIGKEGVVCLPMFARGERVGVIVIGLDRAEFSHLSKQFKLLSLFSNQAALALHVDYIKRTRLKTIQSERLSASLALSQKVVHEVNTPLSIMKNYLTVMRRKLAEDKVVQEELRIINEEIDRVAHIIRELSDFSEPEILTTDSIEINALLSDLIKVFQESFLQGSNIKAYLELDHLLPSINTDKNRLKQVFINLIQNAVEAMPGGGNIWVSTRYTSNKLDTQFMQDSGRDLGYVEITIRDDGPGIPDTFKTRLFEPFITSKGAGHAGLGLSIVYNTVKELNGTITCESGNENGACFRIVFPIVKNQESELSSLRSQPVLRSSPTAEGGLE